VPGKNVRPLAGHPLIAYSLAAAHQSALFDAVVVSTDSEEIAAVAREYGGEVPALRPEEMAGTTSPDIDWVEHTLDLLEAAGRTFDLFSILRPTSPFRTASTIRRAWKELHERAGAADSIRAVEPCRQHPGKMWVLEGELMRPLLEQTGDGVPTHSRQYQDLPPVYAQNSSLEIAWTRVVTEGRDIAGTRVAPFLTRDLEGFTIDYPDDWDLAERWAAGGRATLPDVTVAGRAGDG
jgi:N-acylneuraminate cytidylyltransferase